MKWFRLVLTTGALACAVVAVAATTAPGRPAVARDLELFGPAAGGLQAHGFQPRGKVTVLAGNEVRGSDRLRIDVEGLPSDVCFTVFLSELNDFPFGSLQLVTDVCTNEDGRGSAIASLAVLDAFALKTEANTSPPPVFATPINVDLNHIVLWFADPADDDRFTSLGAGPFDSDRDSGVAVLRTAVSLP